MPCGVPVPHALLSWCSLCCVFASQHTMAHAPQHHSQKCQVPRRSRPSSLISTSPRPGFGDTTAQLPQSQSNTRCTKHPPVMGACLNDNDKPLCQTIEWPHRSSHSPHGATSLNTCASHSLVPRADLPFRSSHIPDPSLTCPEIWARWSDQILTEGGGVRGCP